MSQLKCAKEKKDIDKKIQKDKEIQSGRTYESGKAAVLGKSVPCPCYSVKYLISKPKTKRY